MKKIFRCIIALLLTILSLLMGVSCGKVNENFNAEAFFSGKVVEILDDRCLLEVTDTGNQNFALGEKIFVSTSIKNCPKISVGDILMIEFDGCMALSYPPLVFKVYKITKE